MQNVFKKISSDKNKKKILILGDSIVDQYIFGETLRMAPEADVPVFTSLKYITDLGGAANVFKIIRSLKGNAQICTVIGDDINGEWLKNQLILLGNDPKLVVTDKSRRTTIKERYIRNQSEYLFRIDNEDVHDISSDIVDTVYSYIKEHIDTFDMLVISDYAKGFVTDCLSSRIIELFNRFHKPVLVDPKSKNIAKYRQTFLIKANYKEFRDFLSDTDSSAVFDDDLIAAYSVDLMKEAQISYFYVTLGEKGGILIDNHYKPHKVHVRGNTAIDITGAGDTVLAVLAIALVSGIPIHDCVDFASYAAGVCVSKFGSAVITRDELKNFIRKHIESDTEKKVPHNRGERFDFNGQPDRRIADKHTRTG